MTTFFRRLTLLLILLGIAGLIWISMQPQPIRVDLETVSRGALMVTIDDDGRTRIKERYVVSTPLAGRLVRIQLDPGDPVRAGETLLTALEPTDPTLLDPRARAEAQARVSAARARLNRIEPILESAREDLEFAESELARLRRLRESNAGTQRELDEKQLAHRKANHDYRAARFEEEIAKFELKLAEAALLRTAQTDDHNGATAEGREWQFEIRSPITGRVLRVFQESTTVVQAGERLVELGDPSDIEVEVDVLSTDAVRIRPGNPVLLEKWGGDQILRGVVRVVEPAAFTKVSALGVEEQRVNVIIDFEDPTQKRQSLGDGYRVEARIITWQAGDVLKVPTGALFRHAEQMAVFVRSGNRAELRVVDIGHRNEHEAEVVSGLTVGDDVIMYPGDGIRHGVMIDVRDL